MAAPTDYTPINGRHPYAGAEEMSAISYALKAARAAQSVGGEPRDPMDMLGFIDLNLSRKNNPFFMEVFKNALKQVEGLGPTEIRDMERGLGRGELSWINEFRENNPLSQEAQASLANLYDQSINWDASQMPKPRPPQDPPAFGPTAGGDYINPNSKGLSSFDQNKAKLVAARLMGTRDNPFWGSRGDGTYWGLGYIDRNYNNPTQRKQFMQAVADNMHNYMQGEQPAYNTSTPEGKAQQEAYFANLNDPRGLVERLDYWMDGWDGGYTTEKGSAERDEFGQWKSSTFDDLRNALMQYDTQYKYGTPEAKGATYFSSSYDSSQQPSDPFEPTGNTTPGTGGGNTTSQPVGGQQPTYTAPTGQSGSDPFWNVQFNPSSRANDFYTEQLRRLQRQRNDMREANLGRDWSTGHLADPFQAPAAPAPQPSTPAPTPEPTPEPTPQPPATEPTPQPPVQPGDNTGSNDAPDFGVGEPGTGTGDVIINNPPPVYTQPSDPFQPSISQPPVSQPPTDPFVPPTTGGGGGSAAGGVTPDLQRTAGDNNALTMGSGGPSRSLDGTIQDPFLPATSPLGVPMGTNPQGQVIYSSGLVNPQIQTAAMMRAAG